MWGTQRILADQSGGYISPVELETLREDGVSYGGPGAAGSQVQRPLSAKLWVVSLSRYTRSVSAGVGEQAQVYGSGLVEEKGGTAGGTSTSPAVLQPLQEPFVAPSTLFSSRLVEAEMTNEKGGVWLLLWRP